MNRLVVILIAWPGVRADAAPPDSRRCTAATAHVQLRADVAPRPLACQAAECEAVLERLHRIWFAEPPANWAPKCSIVVHRSPATYLRAVPNGSQTNGSSLVVHAGATIKQRQIDILCTDDTWLAGTLGHELTHVLLADHFGLKVPRWADEGMAVLADSLEKQRRHEKVWQAALLDRRVFGIRRLMLVDAPLPRDEMAAFYGQSASLVRFLVHQRTPAAFTTFLRLAECEGPDKALDRVYNIGNCDLLEERWREHRSDAPFRQFGSNENCGSERPTR
jgi:hypothetical protein